MLSGMRLHALVALTLALAACGAGGLLPPSGHDSVPLGRFSTVVAAQRVPITAEPAIRWAPNMVTARSGDITFIVSNPTALIHDFAVEGNGVNVRSDLIRPHSEARLTLIGLAAGRYRYVCTVPGHEATMVGTLIVK